ncbi:hypothetical protein EJ04DRAFT_535003 [Polyplosphaeria fusca]|uniref:Uncharacterized protein n=1 Tax=Polyplosphaeria fusca TaxID=682080 RepID=A0A9P4QX89_9PLEO|nr:hypothetical protein EJ04DRAFT_535003 [Polyplosphaeria fusca]
MSSKGNASSLTKRPAPGSLMAPPPAPKRIKRPKIVLDEDTYADAVSHIIIRDFFPGLLETNAQHEYLDAINSNDRMWIRQAADQLTHTMNTPRGMRRKAGVAPSATPRTSGSATPKVWAGDTPVTVAGSEVENGEEKKPEVDTNLSLSAFQTKYTSEDQESFLQILDRQNALRFLKHKWARTGNTLASKQRLAQQKVLEASSSSSTSQALVPRPSQDLDLRPAAPKTTKHEPINALMYPPDSIEDWAPTRAQAAEAASLAPPKQILLHNTRLPVVPDDPPRPPSPTTSAIHDAIAGNPRRTQSELEYAGAEPGINNYAFVDESEPPRDLLSKFDIKSEPSPFTIREASAREKLHHALVDRNNEKNKAAGKGMGLLGGQTPRFASAPKTPGRRNAAELTPAGRKLFDSIGGRTPRRSVAAGLPAPLPPPLLGLRFASGPW